MRGREKNLFFSCANEPNEWPLSLKHCDQPESVWTCHQSFTVFFLVVCNRRIASLSIRVMWANKHATTAKQYKFDTSYSIVKSDMPPYDDDKNKCIKRWWRLTKRTEKYAINWFISVICVEMRLYGRMPRLFVCRSLFACCRSTSRTRRHTRTHTRWTCCSDVLFSCVSRLANDYRI